MRNRFFVIILMTLILSAFSINYIYSEFFKLQRLELIDERIEESVNLILASDEIKKSFLTADNKKIEDAISEILKGKRIGRGFVLRDKNGKIIFESFNLSILGTEIETSSEWVTAVTPTEYIRFKNVKVPELEDKTLQVGLILDKNFLSWKVINLRLVLYVIGVIISLFVISSFLTVVLLSPIRLLSQFLKETTLSLVGVQKISPIPQNLLKYNHDFWSSSDEFSELLKSLEKLISKINSNYHIVRSSTMQMAHELKTPLTILRTLIDDKYKSNIISAQFSESVHKEINQMNEIVTRFLDWAELENSISHRDLHSVNLYDVFTNISKRLHKVYPDRIQIELQKDFSIFASPIYVEQVMVNLLTNGLKYSEPNSLVKVVISQPSIRILDAGYGIPHDVIQKLGEPFNVGESQNNLKTGHGLGLAMVNTVSKLYNWHLRINTSSTGTEIVITFTENSIS